MPTAVCLNCGSREFRADRALAGRLICKRCGYALGTRPRSTGQGQGARGLRQGDRRRWALITALIVTAVLVVLLSKL